MKNNIRLKPSLRQVVQPQVSQFYPWRTQDCATGETCPNSISRIMISVAATCSFFFSYSGERIVLNVPHSVFYWPIHSLWTSTRLLELLHQLRNFYWAFARVLLDTPCNNLTNPRKLNFPSVCLIQSWRTACTGTEGLRPSSWKVSYVNACFSNELHFRAQPVKVGTHSCMNTTKSRGQRSN